MRLILPKTLIEVTPELTDLPMFFLAGPVLGGGDWQAKMSELLCGRLGDCIIINPCRYGEDHPHYKYRMRGKDDMFQSQTAWERYYLQQAAVSWPHSCLIFWLAAECTEQPRADGKPYAMDTRGEIGEWRGRFMHRNEVRISMGADRDFPGLSTIERNNSAALGSALPIFYTMEEVVEVAIARADIEGLNDKLLTEHVSMR